MSTKPVKTAMSADDKNVVVSFSSDSDDDESSSSSSSSSESSSESDVETTKTKPDKAATPPPPPTTTTAAETVEEDDVETVSFTLSLSAVKSDESSAEEAPKIEQKVEHKTTKNAETKTASTAVAEPEERRDEVEPKTRHESPRNSPPDAVIKPTESDAGETKKKPPAKKTTKTTTKSSKAETINGEEKLDEASVKTDKAAPVIEEKVVQAETTLTSASVSKVAPNTETTLSSTSAAETVEEGDDVETVSFTLSLSVTNEDDSPAESVPKKEQKIESKTILSHETETTTTVAEDRRKEVKKTSHESPRNSPDAVIKPTESDAGETKKKTPVKKATKTTTKSSKIEAINGGEKLDSAPVKTDKAAASVTEEKVAVVQAEPSNTSAPEVVASAVNGETKTATKTVKKKTKKTAGDADAVVVEEKPTKKEIVAENQTAASTESSKPPAPTNSAEETTSVVNSEAKSTAKTTTKKKTTKKTTTESETISVAEEKEVSRTEDKAAVKEQTEAKVPTVKSEAAKTLPAASGDAEASAADEVTKTAVETTTVVKKKTKKVAIDVKSSAAQEDATAPVGNFTADENSSVKQADDSAAKPKNSEKIEEEKSAVTAENVKTAPETTSSGADKDAAVTEPPTSDKVIAKKKKLKKAAASDTTAESGETVLISEAEQSSASNANIDVQQADATDVSLSEKAPQDVAVVPDNTIAESAADVSAEPSKEESGVEDVKLSSSPVVSVIATTAEESEVSNVVTLIQLDDTSNEASTQKTSASTEMSFSAGDASAENGPEAFKPAGDASMDSLTPDVSGNDTKNEESDYSYRRKSMDDFIKRILAEAREEQQKRMATATSNGPDTASLLDVEPTTNGVDKLDPTNKEASMLDRRLASTDRKRVQKDEFGGEWTSKNTSEDVDLDQDLAEIGRYFAKRNPTGTSKYDVELERNGDRIADSRVRDIKQLNGDSVAVSTVVNGQEGRRPQQNGLPEDSFVPRPREETAELVRNSSRPVRTIIDQQSDVVQLLKTTARGVDDLESEIRSLRATFLDRQARIETLRNAVDAEVRAYQADQQAANERIQQQQLPGGHFVRDEFMRANNIGTSNRSSAIEELLGGAAPRRRSGSVSSTSGIVSGAVPSGMSSSDLDYKSSSLNSWVLGTRLSVADQPRRNDVDDDASSTASGYSTTRSRRAGSAIRERTYISEDLMTPRMDTARGYLLPTYDNSSLSTYSFGETYAGRSAMTYAPLQAPSSTPSYYQTDYGPTSSLAASSYYGGTDPRGYHGGDSRSYAYSSFSSRATNDPSRFRRAQSVSDFTSERSTSSDRSYNTALSSAGGQFQSRFLDKVRARKSYGDDQYRSRFLSSDSGSNRYSSRRNYASND